MVMEMRLAIWMSMVMEDDSACWMSVGLLVSFSMVVIAICLCSYEFLVCILHILRFFSYVC